MPPHENERDAVPYKLAAVKRRTLSLLVRNKGNTVDPVTGSVSILPNGLVRVPLASVRGLRKGAYTASISLSQGGRKQLTTRKRFRIR